MRCGWLAASPSGTSVWSLNQNREMRFAKKSSLSPYVSRPHREPLRHHRSVSAPRKTQPGQERPTSSSCPSRWLHDTLLLRTAHHQRIGAAGKIAQLLNDGRKIFGQWQAIRYFLDRDL